MPGCIADQAHDREVGASCRLQRIRKPLLLVRVRTIRASDDEDLMLTVGARENLDNVRYHVNVHSTVTALSSRRLPAH
jgi:hypothetical protein